LIFLKFCKGKGDEIEGEILILSEILKLDDFSNGVVCLE
jgi:hypothetical protein